MSSNINLGKTFEQQAQAALTAGNNAGALSLANTALGLVGTSNTALSDTLNGIDVRADLALGNIPAAQTAVGNLSNTTGYQNLITSMLVSSATNNTGAVATEINALNTIDSSPNTSTAEQVTINDAIGSVSAQTSPTNAYKYYSQALSLNPSDINAQIGAATATINGGNPNGSVATALSSLQGVLSNPAANATQQSEAAMRLGNYDQSQFNTSGAMSYYTQASQLTPESVNPLLALGNLYAQIPGSTNGVSNQQNALNCYVKAVGMEPNSVPVQTALCNYYTNTGNYTQATQTLNTIGTLAGGTSSPAYLLALNHLDVAQGNFSGALTAAQGAVSATNSSSAAALQAEGTDDNLSGNSSAAITALTAAQALAPNTSSLAGIDSGLAMAYLQSGDNGQAAQAALGALQNNAMSPGAYIALAGVIGGNNPFSTVLLDDVKSSFTLGPANEDYLQEVEKEIG